MIGEEGEQGGRRARSRLAAAVVGLTLAALAAQAHPTHAHAAQLRGFADPVFLSSDGAAWLDRARATGARIVRIAVDWSAIAGQQPPADPANPGDPRYDFATLDGAVSAAATAGLEVLLTLDSAPTWAEGPGRPADARAGVWKPDPGAYGAFAHAVARRYSGVFDPPGPQGPLPRVTYFQAWNEPNLDLYLAPQSENGVPASPSIYKGLLNALYAQVKAVHPDNVVVTAGTGPFGDTDRARRLRPLLFWRHVLCLRGRRTLTRRPCATKASFDILAHHPINPLAGPGASASHPDDVTVPDLRSVRRTLRAAERKRTVAPASRHRLWATELWWETDPPDPSGVGPRKQARWITEALYRLWRQGVKVVLLLPIVDAPAGGFGGFDLQSGVFFSDGTAKPGARAFAFPFFAERTGNRRVRAWLIAPRAGRVVVQARRRGGWVAEKRVPVNEGEIVQRALRINRPARLRAKLDELVSLPWKARR